MVRSPLVLALAVLSALLPTQAAAQTTSAAVVDERVTGDLVAFGSTHGALARLLELERSGGATPELLAPAARHTSPLVRLALTQLLARRPSLEPSGALRSLSSDADDSVALAAILSLSRSRQPGALDALDGYLGEPDPARREAAAIALAVRAALAHVDGLDPVPTELLDVCRPLIVTPEGQRWLDAIDHAHALEVAETAWSEAHARLREIERDEGSAHCAARLRANPGLLVPPSTDPASARLTEPLSWPSAAQLRPIDRSLSVLLVTGQHDRLADQRFSAEDEARSVERFVERLSVLCARSDAFSLPTVELGPVDDPPTTTGTIEGFGWTGVALGVANNPLAWRDGGGDFLIGEDIELTLVPEVRYHLLSGRWLGPGEPSADPDAVSDGWLLDVRGGAMLSTAFFESRSRPAGAVRLVHDRPVATRDDGRIRHRRIAAHTELEPGMGAIYRDVSRQPAPLVDVGLRLDRVVGGDRARRRAPDAHVGGAITFVNYVFDDANSPPRDRRWLEAAFDGHWLAGAGRPVELGLRGDLEARSNAQVNEVVAMVGSVAPLLRWRYSVPVDLWLGVGAGWLTSVPYPLAELDPDGDAPFAEVIGGLATDHRVEITRFFAIDFQLSLQRQVALLGRDGYVGVSERAHAEVGIALPEAMRDAIGLSVFAERARAHDTGDAIGWAGLELFIPVGIVDVAQEIAYEMRYMALFDDARFGGRSREVFEAVLTAGARF